MVCMPFKSSVLITQAGTMMMNHFTRSSNCTGTSLCSEPLPCMMSQCTVTSKFKIKCEYTDLNSHQNHTLYNEQDNLECKYILTIHRLPGTTPGDQVLSLPSGKNWFDFVLFSHTFVPALTQFATVYALFIISYCHCCLSVSTLACV